LKTDPELNAMFREIAKQQAAMEKRLLEKFPDIAAKAEESKKLTAEHSKINEKLMAVREKIAKAETAATPEKK
jgi:flagellar motility protein MotE (MotC chaperone)